MSFYLIMFPSFYLVLFWYENAIVFLLLNRKLPLQIQRFFFFLNEANE